MAKSPEMVAAISEIMGRDPLSLRVALRRLHEADLIAVTGKGRGAKDMTAYDAACLLLATAGGTPLKDAPEAVATYRNRRTFAEATRLASRAEIFGGYFSRDLIAAILTSATFGRALAGIIRCAADQAAFDDEWLEAGKANGGGWRPFLNISVIGPHPSGRITIGYNRRPIIDIGYGFQKLMTGDYDAGYAEVRQFGIDTIAKIANVIGMGIPTIATTYSDRSRPVWRGC
jgi:hypothetical protein